MSRSLHPDPADAKDFPTMPPGSILVITGASGSGKTTLVGALAKREMPSVRFHHFDSVGVPSAEEMIAAFGSGEGWQRSTLDSWIGRLAAGAAGEMQLLEGQVRPADVRDAFVRHGVQAGRILLLDCSPEVRERRLRHDRRQPELATSDMQAWAAYLRGQADALGIPVFDTSSLPLEAAIERLHAVVNEMIASGR